MPALAEEFSNAMNLQVNTSISGNVTNEYCYEQNYYKFLVFGVQRGEL